MFYQSTFIHSPQFYFNYTLSFKKQARNFLFYIYICLQKFLKSFQNLNINYCKFWICSIINISECHLFILSMWYTVKRNGFVSFCDKSAVIELAKYTDEGTDEVGRGKVALSYHHNLTSKYECVALCRTKRLSIVLWEVR